MTRFLPWLGLRPNGSYSWDVIKGAAPEPGIDLGQALEQGLGRRVFVGQGGDEGNSY
jgi:hypothetical protein